MSGREIAIHYRRLPDHTHVFRQWLLEDAGDRVVTFLPAAELRRPVEVGGAVVLEPGAPVIWFTYPGRWYDIGRFHRADGTFTGTYANILTPVDMHGDRWDTTDLCLDVWVGADGRVELLDHDEFTGAVERGWLDPDSAATARATADRLVAAARAGSWPPPHVAEWDLERARAHMRRTPPFRSGEPGP